jgi:hypothetical protein
MSQVEPSYKRQLSRIIYPFAAASILLTHSAARADDDGCDQAYWDWNDSVALKQCEAAANAGGPPQNSGTD